MVSDDPDIADIWSEIGATIARTNEDVRELYATAASNFVWLAPRHSDMLLLGNIVGSPKGNHRLLCLEPTEGSIKHYLDAKFSRVVSPDDQLKLLPLGEIAEIFASADSEDFFLGGTIDKANDSVILYRGNLEPITLPLSWFEAGPNSPQPDPDDFEIIDFGQTVRLGEFEAGADAILYEFDPSYRRRDKERRLDSDDSFGGALRRLRLQKGLKQSDFSPSLSAKEVGRIERGEVKTVHQKTLDSLALHLGVAPEEIETY
ncbi:MAG: hypothetical protein BZY83_04175 [SAR202 cluster bacterium Casp-Chloro-G2]|nr:MAG: hypothetical protein BZY83_04175 [SAR202 cluster bacterium Casp-Chloro-G2]